MSQIHLQNVSIRFRLYQPHGLKEALFQRLPNQNQVHWGLRDFSLKIKGGDRLGVVGANGAGKTTLLKIISKVYRPTQGSVEVEGRIAPLIEIGAGFSPELTGEENVLLNGSMLGLKKKILREKMDSIFDFSGLEKFRNVPIKYYSTGMVLRLGFSIATEVPPDILILDELFAGADAEFISRAQNRLEQYISKSNILITVAHDLEYIRRYCNRAIWIHEGKIASSGEVTEVLREYQV